MVFNYHTEDDRYQVYFEATHRLSNVPSPATISEQAELLAAHPERGIRIPIFSPLVRSLNLSTAAGIILYEALRQTGRLG